MTCLLDTHFVVWVVTKSRRLRKYPWLSKYEPWAVSPASLLEIQLLSEVGRLRIDNPRFSREITTDPRFQFDDVPFATLIQKSLELSWTRDPFDRIIAAHSLSRLMPLCSVDEVTLQHHKLRSALPWSPA
ncbi:MAG TPA: PIN domain-containing protein [Terriglobia bacterium]|jgi:PIN domain nuclease of toxin-antitoxin system